MRVGIVGGGIAGLTCALTLRKKGHECDVYERHAFTDTTGAGIQLSPNSTKILTELGLADELNEIGSEPEYLNWLSGKTGSAINTIPLRATIEKHSPYPYLQVLRSDLVELLARAAANWGARLHEEHDVTKVDGESRCVTFLDSSHGGPFDLVVGADGSHSVVRRSFDSTPEARFVGDVAYRALVPLSVLPVEFSQPSIRLWVGRNRHLVAYPLGARSVLNCVFVVGNQEWRAESWRERGLKSDLLAAYSDWNSSILDMIESVDETGLYRWGLHEHPILGPSQWISGRMVLIGDAAHVLLPYLAQGGALAIEDAFALGEHLDNVNVQNGLAEFASVRSKRSRAIMAMSRRNQFAYHLMWPFTVVRNMLLPLAFGQIVRNVYLSG